MSAKTCSIHREKLVSFCVAPPCKLKPICWLCIAQHLTEKHSISSAFGDAELLNIETFYQKCNEKLEKLQPKYAAFFEELLLIVQDNKKNYSFDKFQDKILGIKQRLIHEINQSFTTYLEQYKEFYEKQNQQIMKKIHGLQENVAMNHDFLTHLGHKTQNIKEIANSEFSFLQKMYIESMDLELEGKKKFIKKLTIELQHLNASTLQLGAIIETRVKSINQNIVELLGKTLAKTMYFQNNIKSASNINNNNINNAITSQKISSLKEINSNHIIGPEPQEFDKKKQNPNKFFHINPKANLLSMFKNEQEQNVCKDDNHNFLTIDDDGLSPIKLPPLLQKDLEPDRETSLNISFFENVSNNGTNSNKENDGPSPINRLPLFQNDLEPNRETSLNIPKFEISNNFRNSNIAIHNPDEIPKDLSKSLINADFLVVEYDDKKGLKDQTPSSKGNILQNQQFSNKKTLAFLGMKSSKTLEPPKTWEEKFLSPILKKKKQLPESRDKFKLRLLTMKEIEDIRGEKERQSKSPMSMASARLKRVKTTLEAEISVVHTSKLDITKDAQGNKKINQYLMIKDLGKGGFGKVKLALNETDKKHYVIKIANKKKLKKKLLSKSNSVYTLLEKEIATMKKLSNPNIVQLYEVIDDSEADKLYLVMDFMKKGAILSKNYFKYEEKTYNENEDIGFSSMVQKQELQERKTLTYEKAKKYFRDILLGLDYLHSYVNVIHRDIKPENLLIDEEDNLKIADFGVSNIMENGDDQLANNAGAKAFLAPETWDGKPFKGKKTDVWAACATLYFLVMGKLPFQAANAEDLRKKIQEDQPEFPADMPSSLQNLIRKGLEKNPEKRITVPLMMNHPWVTDNGLNPLENYLEEDVFEVSEKEIKNAMTKKNKGKIQNHAKKSQVFLNNFE